MFKTTHNLVIFSFFRQNLKEIEMKTKPFQLKLDKNN